MASLNAFVLSYNGKHLLDRCIASVADDARVIVVDNGSTDGTLEYVQAKWPGVAVLRFEENRTLGRALNAAVARYESEYVALLNNDVTGEPGALAALVRVLQNDESVGVASPELINPDGSSQEFGRALDLTGFPVPAPRASRPLASVFFQSGCVTVMRRIDFLAVGGYSEYLDWYTEDLDLAWKIRGSGKSYVVDGRSRFEHLGGATLGSGFGNIEALRRRIFYRERNILLAVWRNAPYVEAAILTAMFLAFQCVEGIGAVIAGDSVSARVYVRAWSSALAKATKVFEDRGRFPTKRTSLFRFIVFRWEKLAMFVRSREKLRG